MPYPLGDCGSGRLGDQRESFSLQPGPVHLGAGSGQVGLNSLQDPLGDSTWVLCLQAGGNSATDLMNPRQLTSLLRIHIKKGGGEYEMLLKSE